MKPAKELNSFATFYFYLQGTGSLLGWQAVLTTLDFFSEKFPFAEVNFVFPLPIFIANLLFCPFMPQISKLMSLNVRVSGMHCIMIVILAALPIIALTMSNQIGFGITMIVLFCLGIVNTVQTASCAGLAANFPGVYMSQLVAGYGLAGLLANAIRALCLVVFTSQDSAIASIAVFFGFACFFTLMGAIVHLQFVKSEYCQYYMMKSSEGHIEYAEGEVDSSSFTRSGQELNSQLAFDRNADGASDIGYTSDGTVTPLIPQAKPDTFFSIWKEVALFSVLLVLNYVQTFMLFPGVSFMRMLSGMSPAWSVLILLTSFNIMDFVAKIMSGYRHHYNKYSVIGMLLFRFLFFATFIILARNSLAGFLTSDIWAVVNIGLFGGLNGYLTGALFTMGPEVVQGKKKETAGFIMQLSLYTGIIAGSFLALTLSKVNQ